MKRRALRVILTPVARDQIEAITQWWDQNRPAARGRFIEALERALERIAAMPRIGAPYRHDDLTDLRRVPIRLSGHHVYYSYDGADRRITVHAVWHAARRSGPAVS